MTIQDRLRAVDGSCGDRHTWPRNPDGPEAASTIDALLNGVSWSSVDAENIAQDVGVHLTDAMDALNRAVTMEAEWHRDRGT